MSNESRNTRTALNIILYCICREMMEPKNIAKRLEKGICTTHHSTYSSWFLYPESLHHLEHIHHSLCLTPLNGGGYGTEHARPTHSVTAGNINISIPQSLPLSWMDRPHLQCTTIGWFPVLLCTLAISSTALVTLLRLAQLPSGAQLVMWNCLT